MIDPKKYGTPSEVAEEVGVPRTTLMSAAARSQIRYCRTIGGTLLLAVASAERYCSRSHRPQDGRSKGKQ